MSYDKKIIAITGAESTGKSTLAQSLSDHYGVPFAHEYARTYVEKLNRQYTYNDVELIAKKQCEQLDGLLYSGHKIIILDTWLIITKIWFQVVFKNVPNWIDKTIKETHIDLFLVCETDLPWINDKVRENGGTAREDLQTAYINELEKYNFDYKIISGKNSERLQKALDYIAEIYTQST